MPTIELRADLNSEDDEGRWWSLLRDAQDPTRIVPGAVVVAGTERYWATSRIDQVDDDGQVHFVAVDDAATASDAGADFYRSSTGTTATGDDGEVQADTPTSRTSSSAPRSGTRRNGPVRPRS